MARTRRISVLFLSILMLAFVTSCSGEEVMSNDALWNFAMTDAVFTEYGEIWATSLGEMKAWYEENREGVKDWNLRFAQLLGVHENEGYTRFSAFWIAPEDVIRPAYITDVTKQMKNDYSCVTDKAYKSWFDQNILWSYFESDYPWTRLGYTYDWSGRESEYGLTEFLVSDGSKTEIAFTYTTEEFVDWLEGQIRP